MSGAMLSRTKLHGGKLRGAILVGAVLDHADLTDADLEGTVLNEVSWLYTLCPDGSRSPDAPTKNCCHNLNGAVPASGCLS
jgi:uncharacterized protein YjbI with pentapeptide repeats